MASQGSRQIEISLAERRPATALAFGRERDFKAERFQDLDRSDPNVRFVITDKGIVPKNDTPL